MGLDEKTVLKKAIQLLPGGTLIKSLTEGAGSLTLKKAAEKVGMDQADIEKLLTEAGNLARSEEYIKDAIEREEEARLQLEIDIMQNAVTFTPGIQRFRATIRPVTVLLLVTLVVVLAVISQILTALQLGQLEIRKEIFILAQTALMIWFVSRGIEKLMNRNR